MTQDKNYICNSSKYGFGKGYIMMPVEINGLSEKFKFEQKEYIVKSSFHVSLVCVKNIAKEDKDLESKIISKFCEFVGKYDVSFVKYFDEFRFAKIDERESIIIRCEISNLNNFIDSLSKDLGLDIPYPPTHATLYTLEKDAGIGLNSFPELEEKSRIINIDDNIKKILNK